MTVAAALFDVDYTLARPGPELGPDGYVRLGRRFGLELDPHRYEEGRLAALASLERHPELLHDEEMWIAFTERIVTAMGGDPERARQIAVAVQDAWQRSENFDLYEDVLPVFERLRRHGIKIGLVSNGARDIGSFAEHHGLAVDAAVGSRAHGKVKPDPTIFRAALEALGVEAASAVMVGDSPDDDVAGARAVGMRAFLIDRDGRFPDEPERLSDLYELLPELGIP